MVRCLRTAIPSSVVIVYFLYNHVKVYIDIENNVTISMVVCSGLCMTEEKWFCLLRHTAHGSSESLAEKKVVDPMGP